MAKTAVKSHICTGILTNKDLKTTKKQKQANKKTNKKHLLIICNLAHAEFTEGVNSLNGFEVKD